MIKIKDFSIKYDNKILYDKFSCTIEKNKLTVISGASGCGKTTLLNAIGMLESKYEGEIEINGNKNCKFDSKIGRKLLKEEIGFLFQNYGLIDNKTVSENLDVGIYFKKMSKQVKLEKKIKILSELNLEDKFNTKVYKLSGGEQQRIALARLLLKDCNIILADEPTGSLDEENRDFVMSFLLKLRDEGKAVIIVTHDSYIMQMADVCINI